MNVPLISPETPSNATVNAVEYPKLRCFNIVPASELLKCKVPKTIMGHCKKRINYTHRNEKISSCGYRFTPEIMGGANWFEILLSIALQQKKMKTTAAILNEFIDNLISPEYQYFRRYNTARSIYIGVLKKACSHLNKYEFQVIANLGILLKIYETFKIIPLLSIGIVEYLTEQGADARKSSEYSPYDEAKQKIGRLSLLTTDGAEIVKWYTRHLSIVEKCDSYQWLISSYADPINEYRADAREREAEKQRQMEYQNRKNAEESQRLIDEQYRKRTNNERIQRENALFRVFLRDYCDILPEQVDVIMKTVPPNTNCKTVHNVTNDLLNSFVPFVCIKNITSALTGTPNKNGDCPLCYIYGAGGPCCKMHNIYKPRRVIDVTDCPVCMAAKIDIILVRCDHEFCQSCIDKWLTNHSTCPVCRASLK